MSTLIKPKFALFLIGMALVTSIAIPMLAISGAFAHAASTTTSSSPAKGGLDCNGDSKIQQSLAHHLCKDFGSGYEDHRGYDNGKYVGHDEPTVNFFSNEPGSGNNMQWQITLSKENPLPATQTFENTPAFWFGLTLCDPNGFPQKPCTPDSDQNHAPRFNGDPNTSGSAFLELQFYPPGFSPWITRISCDLKHWCAALNIDSLECKANFVTCNNNCTEPVNFAFIQLDGVPTGPPGPASQTNASFTPNNQTLLMNQGDTIMATIKDTPNGLLTRVDDETTGQSGFMVASASNGFQSLNVNTCHPTNFSFHPEYSTAKFGNFLNWGLGQGNVGYDIETGHFEVGKHGDRDSDDAPCFPGPTVAGCIGTDSDFDGTSYLPDWPDGTKNNATPLTLSSVAGNGIGPISSPTGQADYQHVYPALQFDTEVLATETTCTLKHLNKCTVPPPGASFYPFFAQSGTGANCILTFGNDIRGSTINDFGRDLEYGAPNIQWSFLDSSGGIRPNPCTPQSA
jgi:hypothetical protein